MGLGLLYQFDIQSLIGRVSEGFEFGATTVDEGSAARHEQYFALLRGWYENPLIGAGHGASVYGSIRSETRPWAYELSYMALLFQCGLLGFVAYAGGVFWIYWKGIETIRCGGGLGRSMLALLVGMTCYLIANATNPYLSRFDGIWAIFLPLAFINYSLVLRSERPKTLLIGAFQEGNNV
jgi:O-antigen ligase